MTIRRRTIQGTVTVHQPGTYPRDVSPDNACDAYIQGIPAYKRYWDLPKNEFGLDRKYLESQHPFRTCGFLPLDRMGKVKGYSGVHICQSTDLSQWTPEELRHLGVTEGIIQKVAPFCQLRGQLALNKLSKRPLALRKEEAVELHTAVTRDITSRIAAHYDFCVNGRRKLKPWRRLHSTERTAIYEVMSECEPKTINRGVRDVPLFWSMACDQNWQNAAQCLRQQREGEFIRSGRSSARLLESRAGSNRRRSQESSRHQSPRSGSARSRNYRSPQRPLSTKSGKRRIKSAQPIGFEQNAQRHLSTRSGERQIKSAQPIKSENEEHKKLSIRRISKSDPEYERRFVGHTNQRDSDLGSSRSVSLASPISDSRQSSRVTTPIPTFRK